MLKKRTGNTLTIMRRFSLVLLLAIFLRLVLINQSFWLDEAAQALESHRPLSQQLNIKDDFQPPFYHLVVHVLTYVSLQEWWLRLTSLIPGLFTVWYTMKLAQLLFNPQVALISGLLLSVSQFHIFYSQELRPYSLAAFLAMYSLYHFYEFTHQKRQESLYKVTLANILGLFTMYLYPLFIVAQFLVAWIFYPNKRKHLSYSLLVTGLAFLPWLPKFLMQLQAGTGLLTTLPGWSQAVSPAFIKMLPLTVVKLAFGRIIIDPVLFDIIPLTVLFCALGYLLIPRNKISSLEKQLWLLMVLPLVLALLISLKVPVLDPKRVLYILPVVSLLIASKIRTRWSKPAISLILIIQLLGLYRYWVSPLNQREPWRQAIAEIETLADTNTLIVFAFSGTLAPWQWYAAPQLHTYSVVPVNSSKEAVTAKLSLVNQYETIVTFDYLADLTDPDRHINSFLIEHGYQEKIIKNYPGIGFVRFYTRLESFAFVKPY